MFKKFGIVILREKELKKIHDIAFENGFKKGMEKSTPQQEPVNLLPLDVPDNMIYHTPNAQG